MPLAETVSIDGGVLAAILAAVLAAFLLWVAAVALGIRWARDAGRGSRQAAVLWALAAVVVLLPALSLSIGLVAIVPFAAQVLVFLSARRDR